MDKATLFEFPEQNRKPVDFYVSTRFGCCMYPKCLVLNGKIDWLRLYSANSNSNGFMYIFTGFKRQLFVHS